MKDKDFKSLALLIISAKEREDYDTLRLLYTISKKWYGNSAEAELEQMVFKFRN